MMIAELRGKISSSGQNLSETSEDLLVSNVFGCLRYVPPECGLVQFLQTARTLSKQEFLVPHPIVCAHWSFWPSIHFPGRTPCEPDVVIGLESQEGIHIVMIEAKYFSEKSSYENESERPHDQLARELNNLEVLEPDALGWSTIKKVVSRSLLYITRDASIPSTALQESLREYRQKRNREGTIYWTSWRYLEVILKEQIQSLKDQYQATVLKDIRQLLEKKGLTMFRGMTPLTTFFDERTYVFYSASPTCYHWPDILTTSFDERTYAFYSVFLRRYHWPDILSALESMPIYSYIGGGR